MKMERQRREEKTFIFQFVNVHGFVNFLYDSNLAITRTSALYKNCNCLQEITRSWSRTRSQKRL